MLKLETVAVVSHDAGGAEILSSWVSHSRYNCSVVAAGPAIQIFKRKCPQIKFLSLEEALDECAWVLCGTGWQSGFERQAIALGKLRGKKTVAFLDHWVNYLERFQESGGIFLPEEIWVGDKEAKRIASQLFPDTPVMLQENPYIEDLLGEIVKLNQDKPKSSIVNVLYVCEPVAEHALVQYGDERYLGYTEHDALCYFLENIELLGQKVDSITIRPHPSESVDKYFWAIDRTPLQVKLGGQESLLKEIIESEIVVGCESMAMVVGLIAKKRVISTIPPEGRKCQLPQQEIEHLYKLASGYMSHV